MTWHCSYCGARHLETTLRCPALAFDAIRQIRASRWMRPTADELQRLAEARDALRREADGGEARE